MLPVRSRMLPQVAVALLLGAASASLAGACSDAVTTAPAADAGGADSSSVERAACPKAVPPAGSACTLPEGTTCDFGQCGKLVAQCTRGAWLFGSNGLSKLPCPETVPSEGSQCPACWPADVTCTYGSTDCSLEDASPNTATASCPGGGPVTSSGSSGTAPPNVTGRWRVDIRPCRDGGADVQGDGEPAGD